LVLPLIGGIDAARAREITRALLASVSEHKAQVVVIDVSGVTAIDAEVTNALDRAVQAVRLKGAQAIIAGISDVLAETIIDLGIDWSSIDTPRDLPSGVALALRKLNLHITRQL
jgi:rsbT co-antagonist protein RsbR